MTESVRSRFWLKVDRKGPTDCWKWTGALSRGYGILNPGRPLTSPLKASRVSWEIHNGPIPPGLVVCHRCDNPPCVNPSHLFLGTMRDNSRDAVSKGRNYQVPARLKARGEKHGGAKLVPADILFIREWFEAGWTQEQLAKVCGVSVSTVKKVTQRKTWLHV